MNIAQMSKLAFLKVEKYEYKNENVCDFRHIPRPQFCVGLLLRGNAVFSSDNGDDIHISPGDIIFVPITSRYISKWRGEPDITYISLHFAFGPQCGISEQNHFALQKVTLPDFEGLKNKFSFILANYDGDTASQMAALGVFFDVLGNILPRLCQTERHSEDKRIERAVEYINLNSEKKISVSYLAELSCMSVPNFYMQFKKYTLLTPIEYKNNVSIGRAMRLLNVDNRLSIEEISDMLGFESSTYFRRVFKRVTGKTPLQYKKSKIEL